MPEKVYISFDVDGLDPSLCHSTGTPLPGGLLFNEVLYILQYIKQSGRTLIGFDLSELGGGSAVCEFDANVGARILCKLCGIAAATNDLLPGGSAK